MKKAMKFYRQLADKLDNLHDVPLLLMRMVLAYGFWQPAMMKWQNMQAVTEWFGSMGIPFPTLNAYLAASSEMAGVFLLFLGLGTRIIAIPLIVDMLVAIFTVHITNGFAASSNGFEIPLYYLIMLIALLFFGGGRFGIDGIIKRDK